MPSFRGSVNFISILLSSLTLLAQTSSLPKAMGDSTIWSGTYGKAPVRMLLVRNGSKFTGWAWGLCTVNATAPLQILGTIDSASFQIETESGCKLHGAATGRSLTGNSLNVSLVGEATPSDFPAPLPQTSADWSTFLSSFKKAIQRHDTIALAQMSSPNFNLDFETEPQKGDPLHGVPPSFWSEMTKALALPLMKGPIKLSSFELDTRVGYSCTKCSERGLVSFSKGLDGQWRWHGLTFID